MVSRRFVLAGMIAASVPAQPSWADVGAPAHLAAARRPDGRFALIGLDRAGQSLFETPLPDRGHAAAAHPIRPEAVAFARRPGNFALVIDCRGSGQVLARLEAPEGRHFYGHGAFSADGTILFTTENAFEEGEGRIGIWQASRGYRRLGEIESHGVGPHEMLRLPGSDRLVVANGGIETHPASGRTKINLGFMEPNLAYLTPTGELIDKVTLDPAWHFQSIRHLAARADGMVAAACQWQGDVATAPPLLFLHRLGEAPRLCQGPADRHDRMRGYAGSVAFSGDGTRVAITAPRGGLLQLFDPETARPTHCAELEDVCGVAPTARGLRVSTGTGQLAHLVGDELRIERAHPRQWDNHLIALTGAA